MSRIRALDVCNRLTQSTLKAKTACQSMFGPSRKLASGRKPSLFGYMEALIPMVREVSGN